MLAEKKQAQTGSRPEDQIREPMKYKSRGTVINPMSHDNDFIIEEGGPMSLTIVTKEIDDFEEQERIIMQEGKCSISKTNFLEEA